MNPELLAVLSQLTNNVNNGAPADNKVSGAIRVFKSGALLGDLRVQRLPAGITFNVAKAKDESEYLISKTEWSGTGHIGPHGRAWVDGLTDTGVAVTLDGSTTTVDFAALMASVKGTTSVKGASSTTSSAEPVI